MAVVLAVTSAAKAPAATPVTGGVAVRSSIIAAAVVACNEVIELLMVARLARATTLSTWAVVLSAHLVATVVTAVYQELD